MKKNQHPTPFFKIITTEDATEATIMLYGIIGEVYEWDWDEGYTRDEASVTALEFVQELNRLSETYQVINLRINSPGGDWAHGNAMLTAIQNCKAEVHTYNDGLAASMAADIWLMGHKRHMTKNALLMVHPTWSFCMGHAQDMRDAADFLEKMTDSTIIAVASNIGMTEDQVRSKYYATYKDVWLTYNDAVADGLVNDTQQEYEAAGLPPEAQKMSLAALLKHYQGEETTEPKPNALERIFSAVLDKFGGSKKHNTTVITPKKDTNVTKQELIAALKSGELTAADLEDAVKEIPAPPEGGPSQADIDALKADMDALKRQHQADIDALKAAHNASPGAGKATPGMPDEDAPSGTGEPTMKQRYSETNAKLAQLADSDEKVRFVDIVD